MRLVTTATAASVVFLALLGAAQGQDAPMEGHDMGAMPAMDLPEACQTGGAEAMPGMADMAPDMEGMGEHQRAFMDSMRATNAPMMRGVMAEDPDIAFACGMIPHHQAAIGMSEVELEYGDDERMQAMARKIIAAQKQEIEDLTGWIEEQTR
jgi:uncharacterized protein (DUF305 family)